MKFLSNILIKAGLLVEGTTTLSTIANASTDTDRFIVSDSGVIKYRTGSQILSDIGAADDSLVVHKAGSETITGLKTFNLGISLPNYAPILLSNGARIEGYDGKVLFRTVYGTAGYFENNSLYLAQMDNDASTAGIGVLVKTFGTESKVSYKTAAQMLTFIGAQGSLILTTTGSSGAATLVSNTLNIPNYTLSGLGGVPSSRTLTINGTALDLSADRSWSVGTVTSVGLTVPTGFSVSNSPITSSGDIAIAFAAGYSLPTTASQSNWDTAYNNRITSLTTTGTSGAATLVSNTLNIPQYQAQGNYITSLTGEATASGPGAASVTLTNSAVIGKVLTGLNVTGGSVVSTDTILTAFGKLQNQVNGLAGGVTYQGTWDANANSPALASSVGTKGYYYVVSVAGSTNLNGITDWKLGDWAIFNGTSWEKVDNTDAVVSVNGFTGAVSLTTTNISEGTNLYYTDARARLAISLTTTGSSGAATYDNLSGALNIPQYTLSGLGGVPTTRTLTINGTALDLSLDRSWSVGTVTSVAALTLGTTGTDLSSSVANGTTTPVITLNVPTASATNRGALSSTDWSTFNNKVGGSGTTNYLSKFTGSGTIGNSQIFDNATSVGIGTALPSASYKLDVNGNINVSNAVNYSQGGTKYGWTYATVAAMAVEGLQGAGISFGTGIGAVATERVAIANDGNVTFSVINNATTDTDRFLVSDSGVLKYRTGSEVLSDIGAAASTSISGTTNYIPKFTSSSAIGNSQIFDDGTNVGIGTATPTAGIKLDVNGKIRLTDDLQLISANPTIVWGSGTLRFYDNTNAAVRMTLDASGNLGLGVTPSAWSTSYKAIQISSRVSLAGDANQTVLANNWFTNTSGSSTYIATAQATAYSQTSGEHRWFNAPSGTANTSISFTQAMTLDASGNLGVGSTTPQRKIDVIASSNDVPAASFGRGLPIGNWSGIHFGYSEAGNSSYRKSAIVFERTGSAAEGKIHILNNGTADISSATLADARLTITPNGNVGIGTTSPTHPLSVQANTGANAISVIGRASDNTGSIDFFQNNGTSRLMEFGVSPSAVEFYYDANSPMIFYTNATERMRITSGGNVGIGTQTPSASDWNANSRLLHIYQNTTDGSILKLESSNTSGVLAVGNDQFQIGAVTNDPLLFYTNSLERMRITSDGYVSFNSNTATINPPYLQGLSIGWNKSNGQGESMINWTNAGGGTNNDLTFNFWNNTTFSERMRITSGGNVGIGTTNPNAPLSLSGSADVGMRIKAGASALSYIDFDEADSGTPNGSIAYNHGTNAMTFATGGSNGEKMRITSGGNVGIGTTSPDWKLHVEGTTGTSIQEGLLALKVTNATNTNGILFVNSGNTSSFNDLGGIYAKIESGNAKGYLGFYTRNSDGNNTDVAERMRITSGGDLLFKGSSTTINAEGVFSNTNTATSIYASQSGSVTKDITFHSGGTAALERMRITSDGEVYIAGTTDQGAYNLQVNGTGVWGAGAYVNGSDIALKENIFDLDGCLDLVKQLKPVTYKYKQSYSRDTSTQTGFIAQDLKELFKDKSYLGGLVKEGGQHLSVAYQNLIPLLVKAIQEQQAEIEILKNK